jgi:hypothetical protein
MPGVPTPPQADQPPSPDSSDSESHPSDPAALLDRLRALTAERDRTLAAALDGATLVAITPAALRLGVAQAFAAHRLERRRAELEAVLARLFGRALRLEVVGPDAAEPTGGAPGEDAARRRRREALAHPAVNAALEILGGEVVEIRPLGGDAR